MFEIINETEETINSVNVEKVLNIALKLEAVKNGIFNVIFVDNDYIQKINREYRSIDRPTDVISFALEDEDDIKYNDFRMLGDIYISIDKAKEQAIEYGHSLDREICFLSIHGILHLLGYDHIEKSDEVVMFAKQEEILNEAGIKK